MRSLYWKIFLSFWLTMILIIFATALFSTSATHDHILLHPIIQKILGKSNLKIDSQIHTDILIYELIFNILLTIIISGIICYLLSIYVTKPLRILSNAAERLGKGNLNTRVGHFFGHKKDEINNLSNEFNHMAERLEKIIHSKQRLLQDVSHELRSPLARMHIALELLKQKNRDLEQPELKRIELEANRINDLIAEIIAFVRMEQPSDMLQIENINLTDLIKNIVNNANYECQNPKRVLFTHSKSVFIRADKRFIDRAIENIIRNALYYSPKDSIITVTLKQTIENVVISISDQGPGIPNEQLEEIFNPFYRVDTAREKTSGGYGLGLSIAKQAIALHHGTIKAKNLKHGGLVLSIYLPNELLIDD